MHVLEPGVEKQPQVYVDDDIHREKYCESAARRDRDRALAASTVGAQRNRDDHRHHGAERTERYVMERWVARVEELTERSHRHPHVSERKVRHDDDLLVRVTAEPRNEAERQKRRRDGDESLGAGRCSRSHASLGPSRCMRTTHGGDLPQRQPDEQTSFGLLQRAGPLRA
jgi:hypothetical protein